MRIGYCSPFNPMKSGISDFSEELVFALAEHMEVVLFVPVKPSQKELFDLFEIHPLSELDNENLRNSLDHIVYHVGNNVNYHGEIVNMLEKYPGIVEIHELGLHHLAAARTLEAKGKESYIEMARYCHGERGAKIVQAFLDGNAGAPWNDHALDMCMARPYIERATGIIVHAEMIKQMVLGIRENVPIITINLHTPDIIADTVDFPKECRTQLNLPANKLIMGSFGYATSAKRILPTLDALARLKDAGIDFMYILAGKVEKNINIKKELADRKLEKEVIVAGYIPLDKFKFYLGACDFCFNLRYPTQGESSASLHRMLGMGKPAIVTNIGTFADYPDDVVLKVRYDEHEVDDIYKALCLLIKKGERKKRSENAIRFAKEHCCLEKNAERYAQFFEELHIGSWQPNYEDTIISRLCEMGLTDEDYIFDFYQKYATILL